MPLTHEQSQTLIAAAIDQARADGLKITVAVVDEGGMLKALARMEKLAGAEGEYRIRVGRYRVRYGIDLPIRELHVLDAGPRGDFYDV